MVDNWPEDITVLRGEFKYSVIAVPRGLPLVGWDTLDVTAVVLLPVLLIVSKFESRLGVKVGVVRRPSSEDRVFSLPRVVHREIYERGYDAQNRMAELAHLVECGEFDR